MLVTAPTQRQTERWLGGQSGGIPYLLLGRRGVAADTGFSAEQLPAVLRLLQPRRFTGLPGPYVKSNTF